MRHVLDVTTDFKLPFSPVAILCRECNKEASFEEAHVRAASKSEVAELPKGHMRLLSVKDPVCNYSNWHRPHLVVYPKMGGIAPKKYPSGYSGPIFSGCVFGTSVCSNCHNHKKIKLNWPEEARYQLGFSGKNLWFYSRNHVVEMISLLNGADPAKSPYGWWFSRKLPTVFKTKKARKILPNKLGKMLTS